MLKSLFLLIGIIISFSVSANCDIDPNLLNKACSEEYFFPKNTKELNEYLQYGKFKDGKLLNLEIRFDIKDKEINIATWCDVRLSRGVTLKASLNGICIKGTNVQLNGENHLDSEKKSSIFIASGRSITLRRSILETKGEITLSSKVFNPFDGEILVSKDSVLRSDKINIFTPSNLIINKDSSLKSSNIILNGGNCEIGENDDRENDHDRDHDRSYKKFSPKFQYTGTCATNPLPTNIKILSTINAQDSLTVGYSLNGRPLNTGVRWRFNREVVNSGASIKKSFIFPGRQLVESIVVDQGGYFRKIGIYQNLSPSKFNKGQIAIFQFNGLKRSPFKVTALMGLRKFTLERSEQDPQFYSGEIPADTAGNKLIVIPEFGYRGSFYLNLLPAINNASTYINSFIDSISSSLNEADQDILPGNELASSMSVVLSELKTKINSLPTKDQMALALKLQANTEGVSIAVTKNNTLNFKFDLLNLIIPAATAQSLVYADRFIPKRMREYTISDIISAGAGIYLASSGVYLLLSPATNGIDKLAGALMLYSGLKILITEYRKRSRIIVDLYDFIGNIAISSAFGGETYTIRLAGDFVPVTSGTKSTLLQKSRSLTDEFNNLISPINKDLASVNSLMVSIGISSKLIGGIPTLSFPNKTYNSPLSSEFISDVQLLSSEYGDVLLKPIKKIEDGVVLQFNANNSQDVTVRIFYKNDDFNIHVYKDVVIKIKVGSPKAVINYTKNYLTFNFDSTDPENPNIYGLKYTWDFGDGEVLETYSKTIFHKYKKPGNYKVSLTISNGSEDISSEEVNIVAGGLGQLYVCPYGHAYPTITVAIQGYAPIYLNAEIGTCTVINNFDMNKTYTYTASSTPIGGVSVAPISGVLQLKNVYPMENFGVWGNGESGFYIEYIETSYY